MFNTIRKTSIHFKKNLQIEAEKDEKNIKTIYILEPSNEKENNLIKGKNKWVLGDNQKK